MKVRDMFLCTNVRLYKGSEGRSRLILKSKRFLMKLEPLFRNFFYFFYLSRTILRNICYNHDRPNAHTNMLQNLKPLQYLTAHG